MLSHINLTLVASLFVCMCFVSLLANRIIHIGAHFHHDVVMCRLAVEFVWQQNSLWVLNLKRRVRKMYTPMLLI
jgi:hypothetical protein